MATKAIQPRPGVWNGIHFRSQLEIGWVQWFDKHGLNWEYVDEATHDFELTYEEDGFRMLDIIEIKPEVPKICASALMRFKNLVAHNPIRDNERILLMIGSPPSAYSRGCGIYCSFFRRLVRDNVVLALAPTYLGEPPAKGGQLLLHVPPGQPAYLSEPDNEERLQLICEVAIQTIKDLQ